MSEGNIIIKGARVNNLKNISLEIPRGKLVVVTGISGSGKSSLAFDTLYAEGQRRFAESMSSYARQFLGRMRKPDVDMIDGIPPAVAIEQKVTSLNPRSTVATTTEIYDFLRLVFARIGRIYSPVSGREVKEEGIKDVCAWIEASSPATFFILSDVGYDTAEDRTALLLKLKEDGFNRILGDGRPQRIDDVLSSECYPEKAFLLLDRLRTGSAADEKCAQSSVMDEDTWARLLSSVGEAFSRGNGRMAVAVDGGELREFSNRLELDGIVFRKSDDYLFSFNSPLGACPVCGGLGRVSGISEDLVVPDKSMSLYDGAIACWRGEKMSFFKDRLVANSSKLGLDIFAPYCELPENQRDIIWHKRSDASDPDSYICIDEFFEWVETQRYKIQYKFMLNRFSGRAVCPSCRGSRLRKEALWVRIADKNIAQLLDMSVSELIPFFEGLDLSPRERTIVEKPLAEVLSRLHFIDDVGLGYLTLSRAVNTLSGGESQRINLVTALGSSLVGSMYILDEPSIGLHPRDTERLISVLKRLRDLGNSVIVVEHDEEIIRSADLLVDVGPRAGRFGGQIVYVGPPVGQDNPDSLTLQYLSGKRQRYERTTRPWTYGITVRGAHEHNLKGMDVCFPLGVLTVVTGVSGSGKSSLVGDILYPALQRHLTDSGDAPGVFKGLSGNLDRIQRVEYIDQNPIGRSSRSNAATYLKAFDDIRVLLSKQKAAKLNHFGPSYFSFNAEGGRCPECKGDGVVRIEMQFMADVTMVCEECGGKRFKPEVLDIRYNGLNIDDMLNLSVDEAIQFFSAGTEPEAASVVEKLKSLQEVGLGYIKLGQSSSTLSGGESQRIKLAYFLSLSRLSRKQESILFIFDEPTTGLHFYDVEKLLKSFDALLQAGPSLGVVEHNPDVIRAADWIIDLGPDAGDNGGQVVFEGTPQQLAEADTYTARFCRPESGI